MSAQDFIDEKTRRLANLFSSDDSEAIAGSSDDQGGSERYEVLPDDIDPDELNETHWKAIDAFLVEGDRENPDFNALAEGRDFSAKVARRIIHKVFRDSRGLEDIYPGHRLSVLIWSVYGNERPSTELVDEYPVSETTLKQARNLYPDLIEEISGEITESELERYVEQYKSTKTQSGGSTHPTQDEMDYPDDFTERMVWFIEAIAEQPTETSGEIHERCDRDWSNQGYYEVVKKHPDIVAKRIAEVGNVDHFDQLHEYLQTRLDDQEALDHLKSKRDTPTTQTKKSDVTKSDIREYIEAHPEVRDVQKVMDALGNPDISHNVVSGMMSVRRFESDNDDDENTAQRLEDRVSEKHQQLEPEDISTRKTAGGFEATLPQQALEEDGTADTVTVEIPIEEAYEAVTGGQLSEDTRREIFDQVAGRET